MSRAVRPAAFLLGFSAFLYTLSSLGPVSVNVNVNVPNGVQLNLDDTSYPAQAVEEYRAPPPPTQYESAPPAGTPYRPSRYETDRMYRSILNSITSFDTYGDEVHDLVGRRYEKYSVMSPQHKAMANKIGYGEHFKNASSTIAFNDVVLRDIAQHARGIYGEGFNDGEIGERPNPDIVRDYLAHVVRDWTEEGAEERNKIFPPIIEALDKLVGKKGGGKVMLPGFGLGRLAHDIADDSRYQVDANELDHGCVLPYYWMLNTTEHVNQHTLYPFVSHWTHQSTAAGRWTPVHFPDVIPKSHVTVYEGDFVTIFDDKKFEGAYDAVVTLFFIDVSEDVIDFFSQIHRLLKPGGVWINLGPFKWGGFSKLQLSAEEALKLADIVGFDIDPESRKSIDAVYGHQPGQLLKFTYVTQFWTATKRR